MPETPSIDPPSPRRRAAQPSHATGDDVRALIERAARIPDGLALLQNAPLECVAVLLGVAPRLVERVRAALEDPAVRDEAARQFTRIAGRHVAASDAGTEVRPPPPRDPEQLILAARQRADGLTLLFSAAPEAAAIAFGVHPDLVHGAREAAARHGAGDLPRPA